MRFKIPLSVTLLHLVLFLTLSHSIEKKAPKPPQKMRIVMRSVPPSTQEPLREKVVPISLSSPEIKEISPAPPPPSPPRKAAMPAKKVLPKPVKKKIPEKKLSKKVVAKTPPKKKKSVSTPPSPKPVKKTFELPLLHATPPKIEEEASPFFEDICTLFEELLTLPEKGSVKVTITVQANGYIGKMEFVASESERNLEYLKSILPTVKLPLPIEGKDVVFTITFCDD